MIIPPDPLIFVCFGLILFSLGAIHYFGKKANGVKRK
jgi:hypothetical protein